ncbi:hypothetical protein PWT90_08290 [Aphanocladium album]|nr:hypothetical protein PWT90_08290 [Aphanocladium album]
MSDLPPRAFCVGQKSVHSRAQFLHHGARMRIARVRNYDELALWAETGNTREKVHTQGKAKYVVKAQQDHLKPDDGWDNKHGHRDEVKWLASKTIWWTGTAEMHKPAEADFMQQSEEGDLESPTRQRMRCQLHFCDHDSGTTAYCASLAAAWSENRDEDEIEWLAVAGWYWYNSRRGLVRTAMN